MPDGEGVNERAAHGERVAHGVAALILAAGVSKRMGQMKQLLDLGGRPLLEHVIRQVMSFPFSEIVTVIGHRAVRIRRYISIPDERFRWIVNAAYEQGQSTSLRRGITAIRSMHVMVFLADQPFIASDTIRAVYDQGARWGRDRMRRPFVVRPSHCSRPGHPVFFGHVKRLDLTRLSGDQGAKRVISDMDSLYTLPVEDPYILFDIDTPEAYAQAKRLWACWHLNGHAHPDPGTR